jgi:hypothetical protein
MFKQMLSRLIAATAVLGCSAMAQPASATVFQVQPITLPDGYVIAGTITTSGAVGALTSADITGWHVSVTQMTTLLELTPANSIAVADRVTARADGRLAVRTSTDGLSDGGLLQFGMYPRFITVADFTGYYAAGGMEGYRLGRTGVSAALDRPNHTQFIAATKSGVGPFVIPTHLIDGSARDGLFLSGWLSTNGRLGNLTTGDLTDWDMLIQLGWQDEFTEKNSTLAGTLTGVAVSADGTRLTVANPDGQIMFSPGRAGGHPFAVSLANFADEQGSAGYYYGRLFTSEMILPTADSQYLIATAAAFDVPAPGGGAALAAALLAIAVRHVRRPVHTKPVAKVHANVSEDAGPIA